MKSSEELQIVIDALVDLEQAALVFKNAARVAENRVQEAHVNLEIVHAFGVLGGMVDKVFLEISSTRISLTKLLITEGGAE